MSKRVIIVLAVIWMVIIVAGASTSITLALCGVTRPEGDSVTGALEVVVTEDEYETISRYARLDEVFRLIQDEYYTETDESRLLLGAIEGMLSSLDDPYSFYYTPEEMASAREHQEGVYEGVGLQMLTTDDGQLLITRVFANSPAKTAGLRAGDVLCEVAGTLLPTEGTQGMTLAKELLKGESGTSVDITVLRGDEQLTFTVARDSVSINRVDYAMLEGDLGYIALYEFMGDDVEGFSTALSALENQGARGLIIDVRSNPGGLLDDVVDIADLLLPEGLVVYIEDRHGARESYYSKDGAVDLPIVVLVNEMSASSSEILAGAIQDLNAGVIVGQTTFGKGIVQTILPFRSDGAGMQLTTAAYFTPLGRSIHGTGITPDVLVKQAETDEISSEAPDPERDTQLRRAMEVLRAQLETDSAQ